MCCQLAFVCHLLIDLSPEARLASKAAAWDARFRAEFDRVDAQVEGELAAGRLHNDDCAARVQELLRERLEPKSCWLWFDPAVLLGLRDVLPGEILPELLIRPSEPRQLGQRVELVKVSEEDAREVELLVRNALELIPALTTLLVEYDGKLGVGKGMQWRTHTNPHYRPFATRRR